MMFNLGAGSAFLATLSLRDLYFQWEAAGIFDFFLPALLIFAVIFGVLSTTKILGHNRGINMLIAISIAIISIRVPIVSVFFTELFPNFAIGLAVIITVVILMGLFVAPKNSKAFYNTLMWSGLGVGVIATLVVFNNYDWFGSFWWQENWTTVLWIVVAVLILGAFLSEPKGRPQEDNYLPLMHLRRDSDS